jgi:hypothetical protein
MVSFLHNTGCLFVTSYGEARSDNGNVECHTLVLLREIRDRLDRH